MKYFFDHQTDTVSFDLAEAFAWAESEPLASGVTLHRDHRRRPLLLEIQGASKIVNTKGLLPLQALPITWDEIAQRMMSTDSGQLILRTIQTG